VTECWTSQKNVEATGHEPAEQNSARSVYACRQACVQRYWCTGVQWNRYDVMWGHQCSLIHGPSTFRATTGNDYHDFSCRSKGKFLTMKSLIFSQTLYAFLIRENSLTVGLYLCCHVTFYSAPQCSHCKRYTSYTSSVCSSVCPSVRPSHAGIVSNRRHVARCSLYCRIAKCV